MNESIYYNVDAIHHAKGAEKKEGGSVKQADDLQNSVSMQQFMTNLDHSMQHPVNQI